MKKYSYKMASSNDINFNNNKIEMLNGETVCVTVTKTQYEADILTLVNQKGEIKQTKITNGIRKSIYEGIVESMINNLLPILNKADEDVIKYNIGIMLHFLDKNIAALGYNTPMSIQDVTDKLKKIKKDCD